MISFWPRDPYTIVIGTKKIVFKAPISCVLEKDGIVVLSLEAGEELSSNYPLEFRTRNILAFSPNGEQLWQIEGNTALVGPNAGSPTAYLGISFGEGGDLEAPNWNQLRYKVDIKTGRTRDGAYYK